ncbi:MAG TPA: flagellar basal body rod protein FlgC [Alphaproteobacteria bacterium]|nr:flagellar basal body rod protein FlgC [Alphaproteobacteria bacterium]
MDLSKAMQISAAGLEAQGQRLRVVAENVANVNSTDERTGLPYRRKVITFRNELDRELGLELVKPSRIALDRSDFGRKYDPGHPQADEEGFVLTSNVKPVIEVQDMREAQRSYEANLNMIAITKQMLQQTIDLLRN